MANMNIVIPLIFIAEFFLLFTKITGAKVPAVIVMGDSSVDAGNNNQIPTIARSNFEPYGRDFPGGKPTGRFSNGRVATDFISEAFGLKSIVPAYLDPDYGIKDFADGVTFASAGTGYDSVTSDVLSVIPLAKELEYYKEYQQKLRSYLGESKANQILTEALYIVSVGTNDFLENYYTMQDRRSQYTIDQYQLFLVKLAESFYKDLYSLGARKISVGGLVPMGCMPLERTTNIENGNVCVENYNVVAGSFNDKLKGLVFKLNSQLPGSKFVFSNPYFIFQQIVSKPFLYGFEVADVACCATGTYEMGYACARNRLFTCADANKYVFWDAFHPTEKTSRIIADHVINTALYKFL